MTTPDKKFDQNFINQNQDPFHFVTFWQKIFEHDFELALIS